MPLRYERIFLIAIAAIVLALDQVTKAWIVQNLAPGQSRELAEWLTPILSLTYVTNTGVAFGLFQGLGDVLMVVALLTIALILAFSRSFPPGQWLLYFAMGLQLGGAMGNLTDRILRGAVVDFIDLNFWPLHHWPIFNIADTSIVVGVGLVLLTIWRENRKEHRDGNCDVRLRA
ncbi:MAG: signal peptidase II [Anaerolineae bacterium]|nr:signal peptidase II [Anaerolineae bacterium]MCX8066464.1 signal peptidase II [Anaerolineae bacterium]